MTEKKISRELRWPTQAELEQGVDAWQLLPSGADSPPFTGRKVRVSIKVVE